MPRICILKSCNSSHAKKVPLFRFPADPKRLEQWISLLQPELPPGYHQSEFASHRICHLHFPSDSFVSVGTYRRLKTTALPNPIPAASTSNDKAVQVDSSHRHTRHLQEKVRLLKNKITKLKADPPAHLIKKNYHKLRSFMSSEAFTFLESSLNKRIKRPKGDGIPPKCGTKKRVNSPLDKTSLNCITIH